MINTGIKTVAVLAALCVGNMSFGTASASSIISRAKQAKMAMTDAYSYTKDAVKNKYTRAKKGTAWLFQNDKHPIDTAFNFIKSHMTIEMKDYNDSNLSKIDQMNILCAYTWITGILLSLESPAQSLQDIVKTFNTLSQKATEINTAKKQTMSPYTLIIKNALQELTKTLNDLESATDKTLQHTMHTNALKLTIQWLKENKDGLDSNKPHFYNLHLEQSEIRRLQAKMQALLKELGAESLDTFIQNDPDIKSIAEKLSQMVGTHWTEETDTKNTIKEEPAANTEANTEQEPEEQQEPEQE